MKKIMFPGKLRVRTLGEAVADHAVGFVIVVKAHAERGREFFDLFRAYVAGLFEDPVGQPVVAPPVQIEYPAEHVEAAEKGIRKTVRCMVIGVPNVGKSTLINQLHGSAIAKTGDRPGVTRANQWVHITPYLQLLDSPGLLWPRLNDQTAARKLCYIGSVKDDVVDLPMLTIHLLEDLLDIAPEPVLSRFHFNDAALRGEALLEAVCKGRGFLLKGGTLDYDRCCQVVLDEFRAGKCGRISLERPKHIEIPRLPDTTPDASSQEEP